MSHTDYDLICVGGGLAGASLAKAMAERGKRVLVLERETAFRDRVRGELVSPWGVAEMCELGLFDCVREKAGKQVPIADLGMGPRNVPQTCMQKLPFLAYYHPAMQEAIVAAARVAGAEVRRGAQVQGVEPGHPATVKFSDGSTQHKLTARLIAGADGRDSQVRRWAGFTWREQKNLCSFAGVLLEGVTAPDDTAFLIFNPEFGTVCALFAQPNGRFRAYVGFQTAGGMRFQGPDSLADFRAAMARFALPLGPFLQNAKAVGPLATFSSDESWVEHPYRDGVALIFATNKLPNNLTRKRPVCPHLSRPHLSPKARSKSTAPQRRPRPRLRLVSKKRLRQLGSLCGQL